MPLMRLLTVAMMVAALSAPTTPAFAQGAKKYRLVGPAANLFCDDLTPAGEDVSQSIRGFVIFNRNGSGIVSAVVSLKFARPNTRYPVRLIQGGTEGSDCHEVDGVLVTNRRGNGTLRLAERDVGTRAQIIVDTSALFRTPTYRATRFYVTE